MPDRGGQTVIFRFRYSRPAITSCSLGWVRLMRAYTVLGETQKAKEATATARKAFAGNADAQTAFTTTAKAVE